jgi:signal transduction histidine kinase
MPLDALILVPAQREILEDVGIFPRRFTLELSERADFEPCVRVYRSGNGVYPSPRGIPVLFKVKHQARYVRMTVQEGQRRGVRDDFGLSEFMVISKGEPVSFGAKVSVTSAYGPPGLWSAEALIDGRTPLGIWHHGDKRTPDAGDVVGVTGADEAITWSLRLDGAVPLDRIVLFPYQERDSFEASVFPEVFAIRLEGRDGAPGETVLEWTNPLPGMNHRTPMVIPLHGKSVQSVRILATRPSVIGDRKVHALSEIELWSQGKNLALGCPVRREYGGVSTAVVSLTDGYSSEKQIIPTGTWLYQIRERDRMERNLALLRADQRDLAANSELNATWGSAMILSLTFLIPVFMVERRRLITKGNLDQIRKRISADLHDDIGSNLGSLSMIARTAHKQLERLHGPSEVVADIVEMEAIARESALAMRDIVWMLERQQDSIGDLVQRMRDTAGRLLREIPYTLDCDLTKTAAKLSLETKRNLFLFFKESLHNVVKHSKAKHVSIRFWDEGNQLALEVVDIGVGIPLDAEGQPVAVRKLEDRARLLAGQLQITSSKNSGTRIRLMVKRSQLSNHSAMP